MHNAQLISPQQLMIECVISPQGGNTKNNNPFNEQDYLIGRPIIAMQAFSASDMAFSPLGAKLPVIPDALFPYAFLNIQRAGYGSIVAGQWYKNIPLITLRNSWNNAISLPANLDKFRIDPCTFQWRDTNIAFPTSQVQADTYSVPFLVDFLLPQQEENAYRMAFLKSHK